MVHYEVMLLQPANPLFVPANLYARMVEWVAPAAPGEVWGLLFGRNGIVRCVERLDGAAPASVPAGGVWTGPVQRHLGRPQRELGIFCSGPAESLLPAGAGFPAGYYYMVLHTAGGIPVGNVYVARDGIFRQEKIVLF